MVQPTNPIGVDIKPQWGYHYKMKDMKLITIVETSEFIAQAKRFMSEENKQDFISFIARNPSAGEIITGTGGVRKVRWASDPNKGKSGGSRVIYYYHNEDMPLFLFTAFSKSEQANISQNDKNQLKKIVKQLVDIYRSKSNVRSR